jgi:hypothetical protein
MLKRIQTLLFNMKEMTRFFVTTLLLCLGAGHLMISVADKVRSYYSYIQN